MKKYICILSLMFISVCMMAQDELRINDVFQGKTVVLKDKTESLIQGKALKNFKLQMLHTLKFATSEKERDEVERLFMADIKGVTEQADNNIEMETRNGYLYYAVVQMPDYRGKHRFVCYQCKKTNDGYKLTLAYMRGEATMKELRKMFKK